MFSLAWFLLTACKHQPVVENQFVLPVSSQYQITLDADFETTTPDHVQDFPPVGYSLDMDVSIAYSRDFRDGSIGSLFRFEDVESSLIREGQEEPVPNDLMGRTVEVRTFPDGRLLDIDMVEHIAGFRRYGEVFDLIFPLLHPHPPDIPAGEAVLRTASWPIKIANRQRWQNVVHYRWQIVHEDENSWTLGYEGEWRVRGGQAISQLPMRIGGRGQIQGEVVLEKSTRLLLSHSFSWNRDMNFDYPTTTPTQVQQMQRFSGSIERLP